MAAFREEDPSVRLERVDASLPPQLMPEDVADIALKVNLAAEGEWPSWFETNYRGMKAERSALRSMGAAALRKGDVVTAESVSKYCKDMLLPRHWLIGRRISAQLKKLQAI
jgi:hypothetical protein